MPFRGVDPWREQYFEHQPVPEELVIPIDDATAWELYPAQRWVYNKLLICASQGLPHGPHGVEPPHYPVFSKPIYNLRGMGTGSQALRSAKAYRAALEPGYLWMPLLTGRHVSSDAAVVDGRARWWRHTTGAPGKGGTFDYWTVHAAPDAALETYLDAWLARGLAGFTGMVNFETIGGRIIECHLRMAEQWLDLNGPGWLAAVVALYAGKGWQFRDAARREGYSVVLFGAHEERWSIAPEAVARCRARPEIASIQITFEEGCPPRDHANPPGGFRLAIVNCWSLAAGRAVRAELRRTFAAAARVSAPAPARSARSPRPARRGNRRNNRRD